jgi:c-di-GMP-binding flagellar brake protein YcgR
MCVRNTHHDRLISSYLIITQDKLMIALDSTAKTMTWSVVRQNSQVRLNAEESQENEDTKDIMT